MSGNLPVAPFFSRFLRKGWEAIRNRAVHLFALLSLHCWRGYVISNWLTTTLLPKGTDPVHATPAPP